MKNKDKQIYWIIGLIILGIILIKYANIFSIVTTIPVSEGLVAYYPFDDNANVRDYGPYDLDATAYNGAIYNPNGIKFGSYDFDGFNDYVQLPFNNIYNFNQDTPFTFSFWVKYDKCYANSTHGEGLFGVPYRYAIFITTNCNNFQFTIRNETGTLMTNLNSISAPKNMNNTWIHLAGTFDTQNMSLYVNGIKETNITFNRNITTRTTTIPFRIGNPVSIGSGNGLYFNGSIDDLMIFNRVLSDSEIQYLYSYTPSTYNDTQVVYINDTVYVNVTQIVYLYENQTVYVYQNITTYQNVTVANQTFYVDKIIYQNQTLNGTIRYVNQTVEKQIMIDPTFDYLFQKYKLQIFGILIIGLIYYQTRIRGRKKK